MEKICNSVVDTLVPYAVDSAARHTEHSEFGTLVISLPVQHRLGNLAAGSVAKFQFLNGKFFPQCCGAGQQRSVPGGTWFFWLHHFGLLLHLPGHRGPSFQRHLES